MDTMIFTGTRICQHPGCGKEFDIGYGGGRAKYCPDCRVIVMKKNHREKERRRRERRRIEARTLRTARGGGVLAL